MGDFSLHLIFSDSEEKLIFQHEMRVMMKFHQVIGKVLEGPTDLIILGISVPLNPN